MGSSTPFCEVVCPNDLHFVWASATAPRCVNGIEIPPVLVFWTDNGQLIYNNKPVVAPCGANDFEFAWDPNGNVTTATWTKNGKVLKWVFPPTVPPATVPINDAHIFFLGTGNHLVKVYWSLNGKPYGSAVPVPAGTNDAHWVPSATAG